MGLTRSLRYWLLTAATLAWLLLIVVPSMLAEAGFPAAKTLHLLMAPVCHQIPERSFAWGAAPLGVCHRCFGIYTGFAAGLLAWPSLGRAAAFLRSHSRLLWLPAGLMALDVMLPNQPWDRVATGVLFGFPAALFIGLAAEQFTGQMSRPPDPTRSVAAAITSQRSAS